MTTPPLPSLPGVSPSFLSKFGSLIQGSLCGWDRLRLRGTLRPLFHAPVMESYLSACHVLIKDFGLLAENLTLKVKAAAYAAAETAQRPLIYLRSSQTDKGEFIEQLIQRESLNGWSPSSVVWSPASPIRWKATAKLKKFTWS